MKKDSIAFFLLTCGLVWASSIVMAHDALSGSLLMGAAVCTLAISIMFWRGR